MLSRQHSQTRKLDARQRIRHYCIDSFSADMVASTPRRSRSFSRDGCQESRFRKAREETQTIARRGRLRSELTLNIPPHGVAALSRRAGTGCRIKRSRRTIYSPISTKMSHGRWFGINWYKAGSTKAKGVKNESQNTIAGMLFLFRDRCGTHQMVDIKR